MYVHIIHLPPLLPSHVENSSNQTHAFIVKNGTSIADEALQYKKYKLFRFLYFNGEVPSFHKIPKGGKPGFWPDRFYATLPGARPTAELNNEYLKAAKSGKLCEEILEILIRGADINATDDVS